MLVKYHTDYVCYMHICIGWSPLHEAANHGHREIVTYLLKHGANIHASGMEGDTPLHDAVGNDHFSVSVIVLSIVIIRCSTGGKMFGGIRC